MKNEEGRDFLISTETFTKEGRLVGDINEVALADYAGVLEVLGRVQKAFSVTAVTMSVLPSNRFGEIADTKVGKLLRAINEIESPRRELLVDPFALAAATVDVSIGQGWPGWRVRPWGVVAPDLPVSVPKRLRRWLMFAPLYRNHARILLVRDAEGEGMYLPFLTIISARDFSGAFPDREEDFFISASPQLGEWLSGHLSDNGVRQLSEFNAGKTQVVFTGGEARRTREFLYSFITQNVELGDSIVVFSGFPHLPVVCAAHKVAREHLEQAVGVGSNGAQGVAGINLFSNSEFVRPGIGVSGVVDLFYELAKAVELGMVKGMLRLGRQRLLEVHLKRTGVAHHKVLLVVAPDGMVKVWAAGTFNFAGVNIINRTNDVMVVSSDSDIGRVMLERLGDAGAVLP